MRRACAREPRGSDFLPPFARDAHTAVQSSTCREREDYPGDPHGIHSLLMVRGRKERRRMERDDGSSRRSGASLGGEAERRNCGRRERCGNRRRMRRDTLAVLHRFSRGLLLPYCVAV